MKCFKSSSDTVAAIWVAIVVCLFVAAVEAMFFFGNSFSTFGWRWVIPVTIPILCAIYFLICESAMRERFYDDHFRGYRPPKNSQDWQMRNYLQPFVDEQLARLAEYFREANKVQCEMASSPNQENYLKTCKNATRAKRRFDAARDSARYFGLTVKSRWEDYR